MRRVRGDRIGIQPEFGEQVPADAVALRGGERVRVVHGEQAAQPLLEGVRIDAVVQIVAQQSLRRGEHGVEARALRHLAAPHPGQHGAPAVGEQQSSAVRAVVVDQRRVALHQVDQFHRVVAGLAQRVVVGDGAALGAQLDRVARGAHDRAAAPVLHFQQQHAHARPEHHEVGLPGARADRRVVPDEVRVVQALFQLLQHPPLARGAALLDLAVALGKLGHQASVLGKSIMWKGLFCAKMAASAMMVDAIERTPKGNHTMSTVAQILSSKPSQAVHTVPPGASVREAIELMARQRIGSLLIVDGARILGIFTERDYAQKVEVRGRTSTGTPISEVMTPDVIFVTPTTTSQECMALMTGRRLRHLPVMDQGALVGLISIGDLVKDIISEQQFVIAQLESYIHS